MINLLLLVCCVTAWCSGGYFGVSGFAAGGTAGSSKAVVAGASNHHMNNPFAKKHHHAPNSLPNFSRRQNAEIKVWSGINGGGESQDSSQDKMTLEKASKLLSTFWSMAFPYYQESQPGRRLFYGMILFTLLNSGVSVAFSYISKDFWNALSTKDTAEFYSMMVKFGGALVVGAPVAVLYR